MSNIALKEVTNRQELRAFIDFPFQLYADSQLWVPPLIRDELDTFDRTKNPAFEYADARLWLAYRDGEVVGRIAAIKHGPELENEKKLRFGWIDFIDDLEVSQALLTQVETWASELGATQVHGPLGFNDMDFEGMLIDGFEEPTTIATIYNFPYYPQHLEQLGYTKAADWLELRGDINQKPTDKIKRTADFVKQRFNLRTVEFKSSKDLKSYGINFFNAVNNSYGDLYGFYRLTPTESKYVVDKYFSYLSPKYISLVADKQNKVIAFGVAMPSLTEAFKKAKGRLFPFGFLHIGKAMLFSKNLDLYLIGIVPEYKNSGVVSIIFSELWERFWKLGVKTLHANPLLETNERMFNLWKTLGGGDKDIKRRRCFIKRVGDND
ncbi:MAG: N-acetyltransferase [Balneolaceae bacterium]|nr:N-acetyltransferase [Balneolaceae bacterium]